MDNGYLKSKRNMSYKGNARDLTRPGIFTQADLGCSNRSR